MTFSAKGEFKQSFENVGMMLSNHAFALDFMIPTPMMPRSTRPPRTQPAMRMMKKVSSVGELAFTGDADGSEVGGRVSKVMLVRVTADEVGTASKVVLVAAPWIAVTRS